MVIFCLILFFFSNISNATTFGTLKKNEVNVRNGHGEEYKIINKFVKSGLPVEILHKLDNWYLIKDFEDETGWIKSYNLSFNKRNAIVVYNNTEVCRLPINGTEKCNVIAILKEDVVIGFKDCGKKWCRVILDSANTGWLEKNKLWGTI